LLRCGGVLWHAPVDANGRRKKKTGYFHLVLQIPTIGGEYSIHSMSSVYPTGEDCELIVKDNDSQELKVLLRKFADVPSSSQDVDHSDDDNLQEPVPGTTPITFPK
jgi:hypothetical protein